MPTQIAPSKYTCMLAMNGLKNLSHMCMSMKQLGRGRAWLSCTHTSGTCLHKSRLLMQRPPGFCGIDALVSSTKDGRSEGRCSFWQNAASDHNAACSPRSTHAIHRGSNKMEASFYCNRARHERGQRKAFAFSQQASTVPTCKLMSVCLLMSGRC